MTERMGIGNGVRPPRPLSRREKALIRLEEALGARDFVFDRFTRPRSGRGVIAVAVNGERVLMHLGRDEADAMYNLATYARLP